MINFQVGKLPEFVKDKGTINALHNCGKSLFYFYVVYEGIYDFLGLIFNAHHTVLGGFAEGFFNQNLDLSTKVGKINHFRRLNSRAEIIDDIRKLGNIFNSHQYHIELRSRVSVEKMKTMLISGDLQELKNQLNISDDNAQSGNIGIADDNHQSGGLAVNRVVNNQLETIERIEKYSPYLRKFIASHIDEIKGLSTDNQIDLLQSSSNGEKVPKDKTDFIKKFQESLNKEYNRSKPNQIIRRIISEAMKVDYTNLFSLKKIDKGFFSLGKKIGQSIRIGFSNEENQLKEALEFITIFTIYVCLYLKNLIKSITLKPIEIFKFMLLGFISGFDEKILPEKHNLDKLLIDFKNPIDQLIWSLKENYEDFALGNDKFEYAAGKKCLMHVLEKLMSTKLEYLIRKQNKSFNEIFDLMEKNNTNVFLKADIGSAIPKDNPIAWLFAGINTLNELINKFAVTLGNHLGSSCKSFYDYVGSTSNNEQQQLIR